MTKRTGVKALAFISIIAALCLILILVTTYTTDVGIVLMMVLPLCAALVTLYVERKFIFVYVIATLLMSIINFQLALFVVLPSLISGIIFGFLIQKYIQGYYTIFINSIIQLVLQIGATYLIKFIYSVDMIETLGQLLKLNQIGFEKIYFLFLFFISLTEISISYLIITNELKKLSFEFNERNNQFVQIIVINVVLIIASIGTFFLDKTICYLMIGFCFYFAVILAYYIFSFYLHKRMIIMQCPLYFISLIGIAIIFSSIDKDMRPLLLLILPFSQLISSLYIIIFQLFYKKSSISESLFDKIS